jgi:imidazolonepropionase
VLLVSAPVEQRKKVNSPKMLLLYNIGQLLTVRRNHDRPSRGRELGELGIIKDAAVLCSAGRIVCIGTTKEAVRDRWIAKNQRQLLEIDCRGKVVCPGFVDSHTHPAFVAPRLVDFEKRISGATYEEIANAGGGIRSSVEPVRRASVPVLAEHICSALDQMLAQGTTTVEAKSGYGLSLESELKSLQAIQLAARRWPGAVVPTLLGAHVVPAEFASRPQEYVSLICEEMIPQAADSRLARFVDVFCDRGAFSQRDALRIFEAAHKHDLGVRAHVSQLGRTSLDGLLRFKPASLDHMDRVNDADISLLARNDTVATLVPGANYFLGLGKCPPARKLIDAGVAVALATDYNPGSSPTLSMPFVLSLACTHMKLSPGEAIAAATINGAWALRMQDRKGSIESGKDADLAIFHVKDHREIAYWIAADLCEMVIANGIVGSRRELKRSCWPLL